MSVHVCVHARMHVYVCMHACVCVRTRVYTCVYVCCACSSTHVCACMHARLLVHLHVCVCACVCACRVRVRLCGRVCVHVRMRACGFCFSDCCEWIVGVSALGARRRWGHWHIPHAHIPHPHIPHAHIPHPHIPQSDISRRPIWAILRVPLANIVHGCTAAPDWTYQAMFRALRFPCHNYIGHN